MITEIRSKKKRMESQIRKAVSDAIAEFKQATGCSPSAITIEMIDVISIGDDDPQYVLGKVDCEVNI